MSDYFLGEIRYFASTVVPTGWLPCNGQLLNVSQYQALYSLLGQTYGGNGQTTFALPDLRGRVALHRSATLLQGQKAGAETVTLTTQQIPTHTHQISANAKTATSGTPNATAPSGNLFGNYSGMYVASTSTTPSGGAPVTMSPASVAQVGGGPHSNLQPYLVGNLCISTSGIWPARS